MSDRAAVGRQGRCSILPWMMTILLVGGCERAATTAHPPTQITPTNAVGEPPRPAQPMLLLLEDEPAAEATNGPAADNSRCFVCHVNYMQEEIAVAHAQANISCAACHGESDAHIADESWASGGNGTAPDVMYPKAKINPACMTCHTVEKIDTPHHQPVLADTEGKKVCTDCHGDHRLPQRRCRWK
jgi:hypothetical protein